MPGTSDDTIVIPDDSPLTAIFEAGAKVDTHHTQRSTSATVQGVEISSGTTYRCKRCWSLPNMTDVKASFTREGFTTKLTKLFSAELQVGDPLFDDTVYVSTSSKAATKAFLDKPGVQDAIFGFVSSGGSLTIDRAALTIELVDSYDDAILPPEKDEAAVLAALLA